MKNIILIFLILILAFFPLVMADTTFYEGNLFISGGPSGESSTQTGSGGGSTPPTISCWKIIDNTCVSEELEDYSCPSEYFSTESICESTIPKTSFVSRVFDKVKEFFGIETEDKVISTFSIVDSEEVIEDTEEKIKEKDKINKNVIIAVILIIIGFIIFNKK